MTRDSNIETLRGIAIVLMVLGHVVGSDVNKGLRVEEGSAYHYLFYFLQYIRMPLFTVISGYIYACKPISMKYGVGSFVKRKVFRLLIPCMIAATLFFMMQYFTPGVNSTLSLNNWPKIYYMSFAHFWFAQGIFFVFIYVAILELIGLLATQKKWLFVFLVSVVVFLFFQFGNGFLSSNKWPFLMMFFLWGMGLKRFNLVHPDKLQDFGFLFYGVFLIAFIIQQIIFYTGEFELVTPFVDKIFTILIGLTSAFLLLRLEYKNKFLMRLGNYSYEIYLYHVFATAGSRIVLNKLGVNDLFIHLFFGLILGLLVPILLKEVLSRQKFLDSIIFGERLKLSKIKKAILSS